MKLEKLCILISGKARRGKDTTALFIKDFLDQKNVKSKIDGFARDVKKIASMVGWKGSKDKKDRELLTRIGEDIGRWYDVNCWAKKIINSELIDDIYNKRINVFIISDNRYPNEIQYAQDFLEGGRLSMLKSGEYFEEKSRESGIDVITVRIEGDPHLKEGDYINPEHISETALDDYVGFDFVIKNNGDLNELKNKVEKMMLHLQNDEFDIIL